MSSRRNLIAYLALFFALGGTSYAATQLARAQRTCDPRGSTTIAQDAVGRFYSIAGKRPFAAFDSRYPSPRRTYSYVCAFKQGTPRKLPRWSAGIIPGASSTKAVGRYVALFVFSGTGSAAVNWVKVVDMVTGHTTFSEDIIARYWPDHLVLKADGSVAWTAPMPPSHTPVIWEVRRHDSTGTATVDSGSEIDPGSLAAGGSWLYWTNAGSARSAPFH